MVQRKVCPTAIWNSSSRRDQELSKTPVGTEHADRSAASLPVDRKAQEVALSGRGKLQLTFEGTRSSPSL